MKVPITLQERNTKLRYRFLQYTGHNEAEIQEFADPTAKLLDQDDETNEFSVRVRTDADTSVIFKITPGAWLMDDFDRQRIVIMNEDTLLRDFEAPFASYRELFEASLDSDGEKEDGPEEGPPEPSNFFFSSPVVGFDPGAIADEIRNHKAPQENMPEIKTVYTHYSKEPIEALLFTGKNFAQLMQFAGKVVIDGKEMFNALQYNGQNAEVYAWTDQWVRVAVGNYLVRRNRGLEPVYAGDFKRRYNEEPYDDRREDAEPSDQEQQDARDISDDFDLMSNAHAFRREVTPMDTIVVTQAKAAELVAKVAAGEISINDARAELRLKPLAEERANIPLHPGIVDKTTATATVVHKGDQPDNVKHPAHYKTGGVEVIDLTEQLWGNRSNVVKYVARAGKKDPETEMEDLLKARQYLNREINRMNGVKSWDQL
jgi:hypothetical protein